jgi:hypothetical protein
MNFGNPRGSLGSLAADAKIDGTAAFGVLYLPIPVPFLDLYAKAGVGAQLKFGSLAVRAEYERFDVAGGAPGLLTVGLTKTFL